MAPLATSLTPGSMPATARRPRNTMVSAPVESTSVHSKVGTPAQDWTRTVRTRPATRVRWRWRPRPAGWCRARAPARRRDPAWRPGAWPRPAGVARAGVSSPGGHRRRRGVGRGRACRLPAAQQALDVEGGDGGADVGDLGDGGDDAIGGVVVQEAAGDAPVGPAGQHHEHFGLAVAGQVVGQLGGGPHQPPVRALDHVQARAFPARGGSTPWPGARRAARRS